MSPVIWKMGFALSSRPLASSPTLPSMFVPIRRDSVQSPTPGDPSRWPDARYATRSLEFRLDKARTRTCHRDICEQGRRVPQPPQCDGALPRERSVSPACRGRYIGHGPLERFLVEVVDAAHPVTRGVETFFVADEQHTPPYDEGRVHLLLRNRSDAGQTAAAGWVREIGRGRLCHLANGHTLEALLHPMYQKLMRNAVRWCTQMDENGAMPARYHTPERSSGLRNQ